VVIIGLMLIAVICLVLGLITQSAGWLIASLIATGTAAYLLYKLRDLIATPKNATPTDGFLLRELADEAANPEVVPPPPRTEGPPKEAAHGAEPENVVPPVRDTHAGPIAAEGGEYEVWVIDGRPRYHLGDCAMIKGQDAEPIPYGQATEDGFIPCSLCAPHAATYPPR
jgi:hypothetical protein